MALDAPAWAVEMLRTARVGRLATADAGGRPHVVPVCYVLADDRIYSAVDAKPKRTKNLRGVRNVVDNPHVSVVVDVWDGGWSRRAWVMEEGTAGILTQDLERAP